MFSASSSPDSEFSENCVVVSKKGMWFDVPCKETSLDDKKFLPLCQRSPGKRYSRDGIPRDTTNHHVLNSDETNCRAINKVRSSIFSPLPTYLIGMEN